MQAKQEKPAWRQLSGDALYLPGTGLVTYRYDYDQIFRDIAEGKLDKVETYRNLAQNDLFFLLVFGLQRFDANKPFIINACREVELGPETDTLDLWAREHYKSTVLTYARAIQRILNNPNIRIGIFSHTRPIAKGFLRGIKQAFETNQVLKSWFPEILYDNPGKQARKWSEDDGICVNRTSDAREMTVEAWGIVKGQPTSKHFDLMIFDDVVTLESVTSPEMIAKTKEAMEIAVNLGTDEGEKWYIGTHYHFADYYTTLREILPPDFVRIKPATDTGNLEGMPVLLTMSRLKDLQQKQGPYVFSCQQLLKPIDPSKQILRYSWFRTYHNLPDNLTVLIMVDPAHSKKKESDNTAMIVLGIDYQNWNRYLLDGVYAKLDLDERWTTLRGLYERWPQTKRIGYERYGAQSDIEHFKKMEKVEGFYLCPIVELGGAMAKEDRIRRLVAPMRNGNIFLPTELQAKDGTDILQVLMDEVSTFPFGQHDDFIDCLSRQEDEDFLMQGDPLIAETTIINLIKNAAHDPIRRYTLNEMGQWIADERGTLKVWEEPGIGKSYVIGVYPQISSLGASVISIRNHITGRTAAMWRQVIPNEELADMAIAIAQRYNEAWLVPDTYRTPQITQEIFQKKYFRLYAETEINPPNKPKPRYGFICNKKNAGSVLRQMAAAIRQGTHGMLDAETIAEMNGARELEDGTVIFEPGYTQERILAYAIAEYAMSILPKRPQNMLHNSRNTTTLSRKFKTHT